MHTGNSILFFRFYETPYLIGGQSSRLRFFSETLYAELGTMLQLVTDTQSATKKQLALAKHLQQLRQQCESVENELNAQRTRTSSMLPKLIAKQKRIETRKVTSRKMNLYCSRMGRKLFGDNYTYDPVYFSFDLVLRPHNCIRHRRAFSFSFQISMQNGRSNQRNNQVNSKQNKISKSDVVGRARAGRIECRRKDKSIFCQ